MHHEKYPAHYFSASESIGFHNTECFEQILDASFLSHTIKLQHRHFKLTGFLLGPTNTPLLYNCLNNIPHNSGPVSHSIDHKLVNPKDLDSYQFLNFS